MAISKWFPSTQTLTIRKLSLSSHKQNIYFKEYWQPKNGSPPDKLQQCQSFLYQVIDKISIQKIIGNLPMVPIHTSFNKSILLIKSNTKYLFQKILAISKCFLSTQIPAVQKYYQYQVKTLMWTIMATSTLTQK